MHKNNVPMNSGADHNKLLKLYNNFFSDQTCL